MPEDDIVDRRIREILQASPHGQGVLEKKAIIDLENLASALVFLVGLPLAGGWGAGELAAALTRPGDLDKEILRYRQMANTARQLRFQLEQKARQILGAKD